MFSRTYTVSLSAARWATCSHAVSMPAAQIRSSRPRPPVTVTLPLFGSPAPAPVTNCPPASPNLSLVDPFHLEKQLPTLSLLFVRGNHLCMHPSTFRENFCKLTLMSILIRDQPPRYHQSPLLHYFHSKLQTKGEVQITLACKASDFFQHPSVIRQQQGRVPSQNNLIRFLRTFQLQKITLTMSTFPRKMQHSPHPLFYGYFYQRRHVSFQCS